MLAARKDEMDALLDPDFLDQFASRESSRNSASSSWQAIPLIPEDESTDESIAGSRLIPSLGRLVHGMSAIDPPRSGNEAPCFKPVYRCASFVIMVSIVVAAVGLLPRPPSIFTPGASRRDVVSEGSLSRSPPRNDSNATVDIKDGSNATVDIEAAHHAHRLAHPTVSYSFIRTTPPPQQTEAIACQKGASFAPTYLLRSDQPVFKELPVESDWESIWKRIAFVPSDANNVTFCITPVRAAIRLPSPHHGFGSQMNNFVNEVLVSMYSQLPMTLCSPLGTSDMWLNNFLNPGLPKCPECALPPPTETSAPMVWCSGARASMYLAQADPDALTGIKRFIYKRLFKLRPEIDVAVTALQGKLGILYEPYVGVHIRRGDKLREAVRFRDIKDFAMHAVRLCEAMDAKKIFVASDDPLAPTIFSSSVPTTIQVVAQAPLSPEQYAERGDLDPHTERVLINDAVLLIRANGYVGTASSNLDRWVWFQRDPKAQSISLDDGGNFLYRSC